MALDNLLTQRQPDARPHIFVAGVAALKYDKNAVEIFRIDPDAVIAHGELPMTASRSALTWISGRLSPRNLMALPMRFWLPFFLIQFAAPRHFLFAELVVQPLDGGQRHAVGVH